MPRILLAADHPLFRLALAQAVRAAAPGARLLEAGSLYEAREVLAAQADIGLVLLDLHMPGSHGLLGLAVLRGEFPATAIAMVSAQDDATTVRRALAQGACAFCPSAARSMSSATPCAPCSPATITRPLGCMRRWRTARPLPRAAIWRRVSPGSARSRCAC